MGVAARSIHTVCFHLNSDIAIINFQITSTTRTCRLKFNQHYNTGIYVFATLYTSIHEGSSIMLKLLYTIVYCCNANKNDLNVGCLQNFTINVLRSLQMEIAAKFKMEHSNAVLQCFHLHWPTELELLTGILGLFSKLRNIKLAS